MESAVQLVVLLFISCKLADKNPTVTLSHGGQLRGRSIQYKDGSVDVFFGVRYAKPPVGNLRFKRPQPTEPWSGVSDALNMGNNCPQLELFEPNIGKFLGEEDCLFLDVWTPPQSSIKEKKAVMVWIHGGAYYYGTGQQFMFPYPYEGDVIIVSIQYRVGVLGFLTDGSPGSGNFGLWDQRQALIWVQENIAAFGGDADRVTIFGESAGAGSVNSQAVSPRNQGLFQRVIQQSGTVLAAWSYSGSAQDKKLLTDSMAKDLNCTSKIYECLDGLNPKAAIEVFNSQVGVLGHRFALTLNPHQDGDFFRDDVLNEEYIGQENYDYMAGFNGQEGASLVFHFDMMMNYSVGDRGILKDKINQFLLSPVLCGMFESGENLCAEYIMELYELNKIDDPKEIAYQVSIVAGEMMFVVDSLRAMDSFVKTKTTRKLYSYYLTHLLKGNDDSGSLLMPSPGTAWVKRSANHGDDIAFVFKLSDMVEETRSMSEEVFGANREKAVMMENMSTQIKDNSHKNVSDMIFTYWTNFAKTGDPNKPVKMKGVPEWIPYTAEENLMMELNFKPGMMKYPHKKRVEKLFHTVRTAYTQYKIRGAQLPTEEAVVVFGYSMEKSSASTLIYVLSAVAIILYLKLSLMKTPKPANARPQKSKRQ